MPLRLSQQPLHVLRCRFAARSAHRKPKALYQPAKGQNLFFLRFSVNAVQKRNPAVKKVTRNRFIGRQHEILDHHLGHPTFIRLNRDRMTRCVKPDLCLRKLKIHRSPLGTALADPLRQLLHHKEIPQHIRIPHA